MIDTLPLTIDHNFLFASSSSLQGHLIDALALASPARCQGYLAEDPHVVAEREELTARKRRLESVRAELLDFGL